MLTKFAVTNYRGFAKRIKWDLSKSSNYTFNTYAVKDGIVKNGIIYGPNGSGKSNLALALFDIVYHLTQKWKKPDYYSNFVYAGNPTSPVIFEYSFRLGEYDIFYTYSKNKLGVLLSESLTVDGKEIFNRSNGEFFIDEKSYPMDSAMLENLANNANNVSIINFLLTSYPLAKQHYLIRLQNFVANMLWFRGLKQNEYIGFENTTTDLDQYIINNGLIADFSEFLKNISAQTFTFVKPRPSDKVLMCKYKNEMIAFDVIASTGTQSLMLLYYWLRQMNKASFVFIDEFDAFYHFKLSYEVCRQLFTLDCQAFVSSHNTYLMTNDLLRPDCNFILANNRIKSLNECTEKELRFGHNIEKMFRGGAFAL
jgi:AAA15 family ATPase/GTPase